jgi:hypothetical protein
MHLLTDDLAEADYGFFFVLSQRFPRHVTLTPDGNDGPSRPVLVRRRADGQFLRLRSSTTPRSSGNGSP